MEVCTGKMMNGARTEKSCMQFLSISPKVETLRRSSLWRCLETELLSPVLSDASGAIYMKQLFLTLKKVIMSSMGSFGGQTK